MHKQQKQVFDSYVRVRAFLEAHPATGHWSYEKAQEMFDGALERAREYAGEQISGRLLSSAELRRQEGQIALLRDLFMRPIVTIARSQTEPGSDVGVRAGFRMPMDGLSVTKMVQACDAMIEMARPFAAMFVACGMPTDFLDQFSRARDELVRMAAARARHVGTHVAARAGLRWELRRCRLAVDRLDAIVRASYPRDEAVLSTWRSVKRVHHLPGGSRARGESTEETVTATEMKPLALMAA